jgi:hypothetical protein
VQKPDLKPFQIDDARVGILKIKALRRLSNASKKCVRCEKAPEAALFGVFMGILSRK